MNIEDFRDYCLSVKGATESFPFDENTLVFKVMNKMFAYGSIAPKEEKINFSIKCDPDKSMELKEKYAGITAGKHTASDLWIAVYLDSDVPDSLIKELIQHSVEEVVKKLPKIKQTEYNHLNS